MFVEKIVALFGAVPVQFEPLLYVMAFVAFLWLFDNVSTLARFVWSSGWVGVCVIAIPLARKVVNIFKQIF